MKLSQLKKIVTGGESDRVEFKASTGQRTIAAKTVCAMSNGLGGYLFFGVRNDGRIIGQKVADQTLRSIASELQKIEPPIFPEIRTVPTGTDTSVIVLIVQDGGGPFCFDGRPYMRLGPTTSIMPRIEYERRLFERMHASQRWENQNVEQGITLNDLDRDTISSTFNSARQLGRITADTEDIEAILRGHGLFNNGRLINAAVVLFGQHERLKALYPQCSIRLARFRGVDRLGDFVDHRQIWGHAYHLLHQAQLFLQNHIPIAARVVPYEMERQDRPLYPPLAIREALANAICHRDYTNPGESVSVAMYDDRLEVISPGGLHFGLQPEDLTRPHESRPWNPIIAEVFYRSGIIERWGTGTLKIIDWCRSGNTPPPLWKERKGNLGLTFYPAQPFEKAATPQDTPQDTPQVAPQIVELLRVCKQPSGRAELQKAFGLNDREHFRKKYLKPALDAGLIERTMPDKPSSKLQKYRLTNAGLQALQQYGSEKEK